MLGLTLLAAPLFSGAAMALIPDDDDEEMVEKAKANRKKKLQEVLESYLLMPASAAPLCAGMVYLAVLNRVLGWLALS